jgi:hypothetical protein
MGSLTRQKDFFLLIFILRRIKRDCDAFNIDRLYIDGSSVIGRGRAGMEFDHIAHQLHQRGAG